jgi:catechol 2,3-dioxygenase-like lactoylglutathione lyase family enzyme
VRLDHVWFFVSDLDRAIAFYRDRLGLEVAMRQGDEWAELEAGPIRIGLHGTRSGRPPRGGMDGSPPHGGTAVFAVDDVELARASLQARGVAFDEHLGEVPGYARYASFEDLDGNSLQLIEYVGGPGGSSGERERASGSP